MCIALASVVVLSIGNDWTTAIADIIGNEDGITNEFLPLQHEQALLVLSMLPEELESAEQVMLTQQQRSLSE